MNRVIDEQLHHFIYNNFLLDREFVLSNSDSFLERGVIDSMGVLELIAFLQETYGITVEDEELTPDNLDSFNNLEAFITRKLEGTAVSGRSAAGSESL
jgi:acyl carrier protein